MRIATAFENDDGTPVEGLSPTIRIRDMTDRSLVIDDDPMVEVGDGGYDYVFAGYDPTHEYQIMCYAGDGATNMSRRHAWGWTPQDYGPALDAIAGDVTFIRGIEGGKW